MRRGTRSRSPARRTPAVCALAAVLLGAPLAAQEQDSAPDTTAVAPRDPCSGALPSDRHAIVAGVVSDSASGVALPGARVTFSWGEEAPDGPGGESTVADPTGQYLACRVPTGVPVAIGSAFPRRRAEAIVTLPEERRMVRLDFRLVERASEEAESRMVVVVSGPDEGASAVEGTVRDEATGAPIVGAQVHIPEAGLGTVAATGGRFRLEAIPPGRHVLVVEHLGYGRAEEAIEVDEPSRLTAVAWLVPEAIEVETLVARVHSQRVEEQRARGEVRYHIGRDEIEKRPTATLAALIRSGMPGVRTGIDASGCPAFTTRSGEPIVVVDGVPHRDACVLRDIDPETVESIDLLSAVAASTLYGSLGGGGAIEIHTRRR